MQARRVSNKDLKSINKWLTRQLGVAATYEMLPSVGFIVPGVAAGFVRNCENGIGMIDNYVSNPLCSSAVRHKALDAVTSAVLNEPYKIFMTFTANAGLKKRFLQRGLIAAPHYSVFVKGGS